MTQDAKDLLAEALLLPVEARAALAGELIDSLEEPEASDAVDAAWADEIRDRLAAVDAGTVATTPWSEARRRILAAAGVPDETG